MSPPHEGPVEYQTLDSPGLGGAHRPERLEISATHQILADVDHDALHPSRCVHRDNVDGARIVFRQALKARACCPETADESHQCVGVTDRSSAVHKSESGPE